MWGQAVPATSWLISPPPPPPPPPFTPRPSPAESPAYLLAPTKQPRYPHNTQASAHTHTHTHAHAHTRTITAIPSCPAKAAHAARQALDWGDLLAVLLQAADDVRVLLQPTGPASTPDVVAGQLMLRTRRRTRGCAATATTYLMAFLQACPPSVLRQSVARATAGLGDDSPSPCSSARP